MNWSVTVGDRDIDYLIPELWRAVNDEDVKLLRASVGRRDCSPARKEARALRQRLRGHSGNRRRAYQVCSRAAARHQPAFMAVHLIALDGSEHRDGPWTPSAFLTLEALDAMIGELMAAALSNDPRRRRDRFGSWFLRDAHHHELAGAFCRGRADQDRRSRAGGARPSLSDWHAQILPSGGSAAVYLRDRRDKRSASRCARC